jgi:hypothetical protein
MDKLGPAKAKEKKDDLDIPRFKGICCNTMLTSTPGVFEMIKCVLLHELQWERIPRKAGTAGPDRLDTGQT